MLTKEDILQLSRREIRYQLYRIRTFEEGGSSHKAKDLKEFFENQKGFTCWSGFARQWDLDQEGKHFRIIKRQFTEEQEWNYKLNSFAEELPCQKK